MIQGDSKPYLVNEKDNIYVTKILMDCFPRSSLFRTPNTIFGVYSTNFSSWDCSSFNEINDISSDIQKVLIIYDVCIIHLEIKP